MSAVYLVVPVLNEAENIGRLLNSVESFTQAQANTTRRVVLVLVDDGSTDNTAGLAQKDTHAFDIKVLRHETNKGPGAAFGTGFEYLATVLTDDDLVFTLEGDNTSRIQTALQMLVRLQEGYDSVLASPYAYGGGMDNTSLLRVILSHGANTFLKGMVGLHGFHTMSSFFRLYRAPLIRRLQNVFGPRIVERKGFESMVELLMKMVLLRVKISEVEMRLDTSLRAGKSKMKILRTIRGYFTLFSLRRNWERKVHTHIWSYFEKQEATKESPVVAPKQTV